MTTPCARLRPCLLATGLSAAILTPAVAMVGPTTADTPLATSTVMVLSHQGHLAAFCSAVVLAPDVLVTAAHCVPKGAELRVHLPGAGATSTPVLLPVSGIARNPDYRPDAIARRERSIDLALLRLPKPLPDTFVPATVAATSGTKVGARFVAAGFGVAREGDAASSGILRSATLVARQPLSNVLLWAEDPAGGGAGACTGDSGGPVAAEGSRDVSAIMVWAAGDGTGTCGRLTQAAWLAPQKPWLDRVMQAWHAGANGGPARP